MTALFLANLLLIDRLPEDAALLHTGKPIVYLLKRIKHFNQLFGAMGAVSMVRICIQLQLQQWAAVTLMATLSSCYSMTWHRLPEKLRQVLLKVPGLCIRTKHKQIPRPPETLPQLLVTLQL